MTFWTYILRCADGSYYTGHTDDFEARLAQHHQGLFLNCHTFTRRPVELVYSQNFDNRDDAFRAERQIKGWRREKKEALIAGRFDLLPPLARTSTDASFDKIVSQERPSTSSEQSFDKLRMSGTGVAFHSCIDERWMRHALALADHAEREDDEIPVGAVLVGPDGALLGEGRNRNITEHDPTAHAEIIAIRQAGKRIGNHRLLGCTLYVTLEPCAMCAMAMVHARIARLVHAATDPKTGAAGSVFDLLADPRHNHRIDVQGGVLADEASKRLSNYFRRKRGKSLL